MVDRLHLRGLLDDASNWYSLHANEVNLTISIYLQFSLKPHLHPPDDSAYFDTERLTMHYKKGLA